jgi:hypothetical protein
MLQNRQINSTALRIGLHVPFESDFVFPKRITLAVLKDSKLSAVDKAPGFVGSELTTGVSTGGCPAARPSLSEQFQQTT